MEAVYIIAGVSLLAVVIITGLILLFRHLEKKRTAGLTVVAEECGLEFVGHDSEFLEKLQRFDLFNRGHGKKMSNVMIASTDVADLSIFDYQYTTGGGQHQQQHLFTIVCMESSELPVPDFKLKPEGLFDKIGSLFGKQDIDFEQHKEFSQMFVLRGSDESAIRHFFDLEMLQFMAARKGTYLECLNGMFIYCRGGRKKPEQIREHMDDGFAVYTAFLERADRKPT